MGCLSGRASLPVRTLPGQAAGGIVFFLDIQLYERTSVPPHGMKKKRYENQDRRHHRPGFQFQGKVCVSSSKPSSELLHGSPDFVRIINDIREVEKELDKPITIMQDLSGPKIRLGVVQEKTIQVTKGMQLLLGLSDQRTDEMPLLPFDHPEILETLEPGDRMVLADGGLQFTVQQSRPDGLVLLEANNSGIVTSRKGLALPGKATKVRALTEKDKKDLSDGLALGVDAVAISYVQTADDVREAKQLIAASGRRVPVVVRKRWSARTPWTTWTRS